jgi:AcrR family transcriptional regulator
MSNSGEAAAHNPDFPGTKGSGPAGKAAGRRLPRAQRREQILVAATEAFARSGFAATSLEDVARQAGVTRMIVYTHFESKTVLYQAVLDRMKDKLTEATGAPEFSAFSITALLEVAAVEPAGFRLLFHHAAREPEFRAEIDRARGRGFAIAHEYIGGEIPNPAWARWASALIPTFTIEAVIAWLDAGQPDDPTRAAARIGRGIEGILNAAKLAG